MSVKFSVTYQGPPSTHTHTTEGHITKDQGSSRTHTHIQLEIPPSPQSFQACLLISTVNKLLCLRLAFHKPSQILGFCECCSQQAKEIYLLTHDVPGHNRKTCKKFKHCCYTAVHNLVRISWRSFESILSDSDSQRINAFIWTYLQK